MHLTISILAGLLSLSPVSSKILSEKITKAPSGWTLSSSTESTYRFTLTVALMHQNERQFYSRLNSISDPASVRYGEWLEKEDVDSILKPATASKATVLSWLKNAGIQQVQSDDYFVHLNTDVATANKLLGARYQHYEQNGVRKLRTLEYSIDDTVADHIALVHPTTFFGNTKAFQPIAHFQQFQDPELEARAPKLSPSCKSLITPACLRDLYNVTGYQALETSGSIIAFGSFLSQTARYADLAKYEQKNKLPGRNFTIISINGAPDNQVNNGQHGEANLDVQNIVGVTSGQLPVVQYLTAGSPPFIPNIDTPANTNEPYLPYYTYLLSQPNNMLPQVISNSYGDEEDTVPLSYATYVCNQIAQLGARGISILASSGDIGVGAGCRNTKGQVRFNPIFPATCPYITAVGGTQSLAPEIVWTASSGGFSDYFPRPSYQDSAIASYMAKVPAAVQQVYNSYTNFSGRGFPDISAHSLSPNYAIVDQDLDSESGGTSAASPVVGAMIGLLNDARLRAGKTSLGFLNPWIYSTGGKGFTDITGGAAVGCDGTNGQTGLPIGSGAGIVPGASWNATVGWDPATGFGVPNFGALKQLALALK